VGIAERKERQKAELREQILAAARQIVLSQGFGELSMRKIADAIEYSAATIYLYFENREAIGLQLCRESFEHLVGYMAPAMQVADPRDRLIAIGRGYARFGFEHPEEYKLLFMTDSAFMEPVFAAEKQLDDVDDPGGRAFQFVVDAVQTAADAGAIVATDSELIAETLWTAVHGVVSLTLTCREVLVSSADALVETVCTTLLRGLAPASGDVTPGSRSTS